MSRSPDPKRKDLLDAMDDAEAAITSMVSRWFDSIPPEVRAELRGIRDKLERLLIRAERRPGDPLAPRSPE
jgi:hypothetical protein